MIATLYNPDSTHGSVEKRLKDSNILLSSLKRIRVDGKNRFNHLFIFSAFIGYGFNAFNFCIFLCSCCPFLSITAFYKFNRHNITRVKDFAFFQDGRLFLFIVSNYVKSFRIIIIRPRTAMTEYSFTKVSVAVTLPLLAFQLSVFILDTLFSYLCENQMSRYPIIIISELRLYQFRFRY